mgnify:CR=1 FL=1
MDNTKKTLIIIVISLLLIILNSRMNKNSKLIQETKILNIIEYEKIKQINKDQEQKIQELLVIKTSIDSLEIKIKSIKNDRIEIQNYYQQKGDSVVNLPLSSKIMLLSRNIRTSTRISR